MGTRHLTIVALDGQYKIAQYGQWDGYPSGQGLTALKFLQSWDRPLFESKVRALRFATANELRAQWAEAGADPTDEWVSSDIARTYTTMFPQNSRDTGADILALVQNGQEGMLLKDEIDFAADGLFCEWAYVIDLDRNTFEVYKGFDKSPLGNAERFYSFVPANPEYSPVKLAATFSLANLPPEYTFLAKFNKDEGDSDITGMEPGLSQS